MRLLVDSHVVLWAIYDPPQLSRRAQALVDDLSNELILSHASLWELLSKIGRGKLLLAGTSVSGTMARVQALGITLLPIEQADILSAASLPHHHSDPFDRMLIAQALTGQLPILSADAMLTRYAVDVIW